MIREDLNGRNFARVVEKNEEQNYDRFCFFSFLFSIQFLQEAGSVMRIKCTKFEICHLLLKIHYLSITLTYG